MVLFHINYTSLLMYDEKFISFSDRTWFWIGRVSAVTFILLAGFSFHLAHKKYGDDIYEKYIKVAFRLLGYAFLISFFTYLLSPESFVKFGIIHFFGISFLLLLMAFRLGYWNLPIAIYLLIFGHGWKFVVNVDFLYFLGFPYP